MEDSMRRKKPLPFSFVLEELLDSALSPRVRTRPMFGSYAVYVSEKIVFILRKKNEAKSIRDDGMWVATKPEHTESIQQEFPTLRQIELFAARGKKSFSGWLNLPASDESFEETALAICRMAINGDPRIGKIPKSLGKSR
jgi:hypothetical protein